MEGDLTREVAIGDIGFCPSENLLRVFFGPTPARGAENPADAGPVIVIGRTLASPDELRSIGEGTAIDVSVHAALTVGAQQTPAASGPAASVPSASAGFGERKLSQSEIDLLVQQLLAEKKKSQQ